MLLNRFSTFWAGVGAGLADAPTIVDFIGYASGSAIDPHPVSTTGLDWAAGQRILSVFGASGTITMSSVAGATNDTSVLIEPKTASNDAPLFEHEIVVVTSLDASISYDLSGSRNATVHLITLAGVSEFQKAARDFGASEGAPVSPAFVVTGGPKNVLVIATANLRGGHDANPAGAPTGYTLGDYQRTGAGETGTTTNSSAWAHRVYLATDLSWTGDQATIPAATWTGWADVGTQHWQTGHVAAMPA